MDEVWSCIPWLSFQAFHVYFLLFFFFSLFDDAPEPRLVAVQEIITVQGGYKITLLYELEKYVIYNYTVHMRRNGQNEK